MWPERLSGGSSQVPTQGTLIGLHGRSSYHHAGINDAADAPRARNGISRDLVAPPSPPTSEDRVPNPTFLRWKGFLVADREAEEDDQGDDKEPEPPDDKNSGPLFIEEP